MTKEELIKPNELAISVGQDLDLDLIKKLLIGLDFEKVDFVYEPGQFAVRGGIIDVFSYNNEYPYRLELFGDEIESIREFDPHRAESKNVIRDSKNQIFINSKTTTKTDSKSSSNKKSQYKNFQFMETKSEGFTWYKLFIFLIKAFIAFTILIILFYSFGQIFPNIF
tara:strand:- start:555 stop:1055 length:501 start_codon:yes stop_codon:yes gene_type:complete